MDDSIPLVYVYSTSLVFHWVDNLVYKVSCYIV